MNKILKYGPIILGLIIGIFIIESDMDLNINNISIIFVSLILLFSLIYSLITLCIFKKINNVLINKSKDEKLYNLIKGIPGVNLRYLLLINLSVAYFVNKDYNAALDILNGICIENQNSKMKVIYYNNKALFLSKLNKEKEAIEIIDSNKDLFNKYLKDIKLAPSLQNTIECIKK